MAWAEFGQRERQGGWLCVWGGEGGCVNDPFRSQSQKSRYPSPLHRTFIPQIYFWTTSCLLYTCCKLDYVSILHTLCVSLCAARAFSSVSVVVAQAHTLHFTLYTPHYKLSLSFPLRVSPLCFTQTWRLQSTGFHRRTCHWRSSSRSCRPGSTRTEYLCIHPVKK